MNRPLISIIIPNLNSTFIDQTLTAIRAQDFDLSQVEVLVVGLDGPGLVQEDDLVRLVSTKKPSTPAVARNLGIKTARGAIFCFTDADCRPDKQWLARLIEPIRRGDAYVTGGGVTFQAENYWTLCDNLAWFHEFLTSTPPGEREHLPSLNLAVHRQVVEKVGLFDETYPWAAGEDADWTLRMRQGGYKLQFMPEAIITHCPNRASLKALWRHGYIYGQSSTKVNPAYSEFLQSPVIFRSALLILLLTPILAFWSTLRIFLRNRHIWSLWAAFPGVFISKVAWCLGAASSKIVNRQSSIVNPWASSKRLTVIIPTLNSETIDHTLAALLGQSYPLSEVEILVVGLDEHNLVVENEVVRFISTGVPVSAAKARNLGLAQAQGAIVCFTDDDCLPHPDWLKFLSTAYTDPAVFAVGGAMPLPEKGYWAKCDAVASAYEQLEFQPEGPRRQLPSLNFSARRDLLLAAGGFDESFPKAAGEDSHLCAQLRQAGYTLWFAPQALVDHIGWRKTARTVLAHAYLFGQYSIWVRNDLKTFIQPPFFMRQWFLMLLSTFPLALWITVRMYLRNRVMWSYWYLVPGLVLVQIAWGLGVVRTLRHRKHPVG